MKTVRRTTEVINEGGLAKTVEVEAESMSWIGLEALTTYLTIGGVVVGLGCVLEGVLTYDEQVEKEAKSRAFEARKPFFERQATFFTEAMQVVGKLATSERPEGEDLDLFWHLYWGRLAAVEGAKVDRAMTVVGKIIGTRSGPGKVSDAAWMPERRQCLQKASLLLAHCIKASWEQTWNVSLERSLEFPCEEGSFQAVERCQMSLSR
jgi:hypothetical protein